MMTFFLFSQISIFFFHFWGEGDLVGYLKKVRLEALVS